LDRADIRDALATDPMPAHPHPQRNRRRGPDGLTIDFREQKSRGLRPMIEANAFLEIRQLLRPGRITQHPRLGHAVALFQSNPAELHWHEPLVLPYTESQE